MSYAPLTFAAPIVGAARGAVEELAARLAERAGRVAVGAQARFARAAADVDSAELLLRRAADVAEAEPKPTIELRARTMRDCSRASELALSALESLIALSGSSGFAAGSRLERAWRDAHFALNVDNNLAHWGRTALGIERPGEQTFYQARADQSHRNASGGRYVAISRVPGARQRALKGSCRRRQSARQAAPARVLRERTRLRARRLTPSLRRSCRRADGLCAAPRWRPSRRV